MLLRNTVFGVPNMQLARSRAVLGIRPGQASPAQAHRTSCQTVLGQESLKNFWVVSCQLEMYKQWSIPTLNHVVPSLGCADPSPTYIFDHIKSKYYNHIESIT
jgi:hypothetical protein